MNSDVLPNPTLRDLACEIGQVQIYWCFLESEMRRHLEEAGLQGRLAKGAVITHWRAYMGVVAAGSARGGIVGRMTFSPHLGSFLRACTKNPLDTADGIVLSGEQLAAISSVRSDFTCDDVAFQGMRWLLDSGRIWKAETGRLAR